MARNFGSILNDPSEVQKTDSLKQNARMISTNRATKYLFATHAISSSLYAFSPETFAGPPADVQNFFSSKVESLIEDPSDLEGAQKLPPGKILKPNLVNESNIDSHLRGLMNAMRGTFQTAAIFNIPAYLAGINPSLIFIETAAELVADYIDYLGLKLTWDDICQVLGFGFDDIELEVSDKEKCTTKEILIEVWPALFRLNNYNLQYMDGIRVGSSDTNLYRPSYRTPSAANPRIHGSCCCD
jgi:hypothetical protein